MSFIRHLHKAFVLALFARRSPRAPQRLPPRLRRSPAWMIQRVHDGQEPGGPRIGTGAAAGPWDGPSDPAYLMTEIEELRLAAQKGGYGTLAYLLARAADEARAQARRRADHGTRGKR